MPIALNCSQPHPVVTLLGDWVGDSLFSVLSSHPPNLKQRAIRGGKLSQGSRKPALSQQNCVDIPKAPSKAEAMLFYKCLCKQMAGSSDCDRKG